MIDRIPPKELIRIGLTTKFISIRMRNQYVTFVNIPSMIFTGEADTMSFMNWIIPK